MKHLKKFESFNNPDIHFEYDGAEYSVSGDAYDKDCLIKLPNGKLLSVGMWLESFPPQPADIEEVEDLEDKEIIDAIKI